MDHKEFSRRGGKVKSEKKTLACRENAKKPRGMWVTGIAYEYVSEFDGSTRFGCVVVKGKTPHNVERTFEWAIALIEAEAKNKKHKVDNLLDLETTSRMV